MKAIPKHSSVPLSVQVWDDLMKTFDISKCDINIFKLSVGRVWGMFCYRGVMGEELLLGNEALWERWWLGGPLFRGWGGAPGTRDQPSFFRLGRWLVQSDFFFSCLWCTEERRLGPWKVRSGGGVDHSGETSSDSKGIWAQLCHLQIDQWSVNLLF